MNFFGWLTDTDSSKTKKFKDDLEKGILTLMELGSSYSDILMMPYPFYKRCIEWKEELRQQRDKEIEEKLREREQQARNREGNKRNRASSRSGKRRR